MNAKVWIAIGVVILLALYGISVNNNLVEMEENVNQSWAQVENQYQRRTDLIPNLVSTVQGAANFEQETLTDVVEARSRATSINIDPSQLGNESAIRQFEQVQQQLGGGFSQWPEQLGFAALNDRELTRPFGDIARREYRAVGLHIALSPQADLATEPRWPRITATFGSRADLASDMIGAYVAGFQGSADGLTDDGVLTVVKHWVGYGAAIDGLDGHNYYGRYALLDGDTLQAHTPAKIAIPWGEQDLSPYERFVKGVNAGLDQFGGTDDAYHLVEAVKNSDLSEQRLDESVRRVLIAKFQLG